MAKELIRACPACRAANSTARGRVNEFDVRACATCGTLFTATLPHTADATDYTEYYEPDRSVPVPEFVFRRLRENVRSLASYRQDGSWLDIGCGVGTLLRAAEAEDWRAVGSELSPAVVDELRKEGLDVRLGATDELDLPDGSFDVVSLVEVVEHLADPSGVLADAARLVRPGGAVYITTPHARGLTGRILGERWSAVAPPEHLQLFSAEGLRKALERARLTVRSVSTHGANPYEIRSAIRARTATVAPSERVEASYRLNEAMSSLRTGAVAKRAINGALTMLRLGDTLKVVAERS